MKISIPILYYDNDKALVFFEKLMLFKNARMKNLILYVITYTLGVQWRNCGQKYSKISLPSNYLFKLSLIYWAIDNKDEIKKLFLKPSLKINPVTFVCFDIIIYSNI